MPVVTDYQVAIKQNNELFRAQINRALEDALNRIGNIYTPEQEGAEGESSVNDTDSILNLIDAMPSTGGIMLLRKTYYVKALDLTKPVLVIGPGGFQNYDTSDTTAANYVLGVKSNDVTLWNAGVTGSISTDPGVAPATYQAVLLYADASDDPYERIRFLDSRIRGGRHVLSLSEGKDLWVDRCTITDGWEYGVLGPVACDRVFITSNVVRETINNAGIRLGSLSDAEPCRDVLIDGNYFEHCGSSVNQDAVDISTAVASRIQVINNRIKDCGNGVELKVDTPQTDYNDSRVSGNIITASAAPWRARIRVQFSSTLDQDHINRILVDSNQIYTASAAINGGVLTDSHNDVEIRDNTIIGPSIPIRLDCIASGVMRRPVVVGNRTRGDYGVYITGGTGSSIDDAEIIGNTIDATTTGITVVEATGVAATLNNPNIIDNTIRVSGSSPAMQLSGLNGGLLADNKIRGGGKGIVVSGSMTNSGTTVMVGNKIRTTSDCIDINAATGTFEIYDNSTRSTNGYGVLDSGAGATVLAGNNIRGVRSSSPTGAVPGGLGDTFWYSAPAAGATKAVNTSAGPASGGGAAVWTDQ